MISCPTCRKHMGVRTLRRLGVRKKQLRPNRLALLQEARPGHCPICDRPKGKGTQYTCGRERCKDAWSAECRRDIRAAMAELRELLSAER